MKYDQKLTFSVVQPSNPDNITQKVYERQPRQVHFAGKKILGPNTYSVSPIATTIIFK